MRNFIYISVWSILSHIYSTEGSSQLESYDVINIYTLSKFGVNEVICNAQAFRCRSHSRLHLANLAVVCGVVRLCRA